MSTNLRIAFRFLTAKKKAMLMSLSCIILGVGLFIVTQATTSGFEGFFIRTILGTNGAILIEDRLQDTMRHLEVSSSDGQSRFAISNREGRRYIEGIDEPQSLINALRNFGNVAGISAVVTGSAIIKSSFKNDSGKIFGINLDDHIEVSDLGKQIIEGNLVDFRSSPSGALLGSELVRRMGMSLGDSFMLESNSQQRRYRLSAIYETGVSDIDRRYIYLNIGEARSLLKKPTGASFLQISLHDPDRAPIDCVLIEDVLNHGAASWQEREKSWLEVFRALRFSTAITVSVFTLIAGLAMFNTLAMLVMEKTKDIAILRSMGYTREDISNIFLWQAVIVLAIGSLLGALMGAVVTYAVSRVPLGVTGIFKSDTFIVEWSVWHYVTAILISIIMVMIASLVPARRAARLEPGDVIRGTAQ
jgi:lipoprotein-releasing system permease protein